MKHLNGVLGKEGAVPVAPADRGLPEAEVVRHLEDLRLLHAHPRRLPRLHHRIRLRAVLRRNLRLQSVDKARWRTGYDQHFC